MKLRNLLFIFIRLVFVQFHIKRCISFKSSNVISNNNNIRNATLFYQIGVPRTGSTFHWYLICTILRIIHINNDENNNNNNNNNNVGCDVMPRLDNSYYNRTYKLHKGHDYDSSLRKKYGYSINETIYIFVSQDKRVKQVIPQINRNKNKIDYIVDIVEYEKLIQQDISIVFDYQLIFNLSNNEVLDVYQHMRYWSILRKCCGYQQSRYNRLLLHNQSIDENSFFQIDYPSCEIYNLTQVENNFFKTKISKLYPTELYISSKGGYDGLLRKNFCSYYEKQIIIGRDFNGHKGNFTNKNESVNFKKIN